MLPMRILYPVLDNSLRVLMIEHLYHVAKSN